MEKFLNLLDNLGVFYLRTLKNKEYAEKLAKFYGIEKAA